MHMVQRSLPFLEEHTAPPPAEAPSKAAALQEILTEIGSLDEHYSRNGSAGFQGEWLERLTRLHRAMRTHGALLPPHLIAPQWGARMFLYGEDTGETYMDVFLGALHFYKEERLPAMIQNAKLHPGDVRKEASEEMQRLLHRTGTC